MIPFTAIRIITLEASKGPESRPLLTLASLFYSFHLKILLTNEIRTCHHHHIESNHPYFKPKKKKKETK